MKILLIGASGTIGKHLYKSFSKNNEVIPVGRTTGDITADITDIESIKNMYENAKGIDAVVCASGNAYFGMLDTMTEENVYEGIKNKLMGQVNLVLQGQHFLKPGSSITLTTGILSREGIPGGSAISLVNGAVESFVISAAQELFSKGIRLNAISPALVEDSIPVLGAAFPGHYPVSMEKVVFAYSKGVFGNVTGQIIKAED
ncbi:MAG TPA: short chain dehydrogenase [Ignavibacteria bacterium]|nr:short chain dehydrogenase [Ignavibacteria bacterium]